MPMAESSTPQPPRRPEVFSVSEDEFQMHAEDYEGICLTCGEWTDGCEPDARNYPCPSCGALDVSGAEEALLMGRLLLS